MKPLDQFKRTPPRRYDKAPPPPPGDKRTFEPAIRKRYFDMPTFDHRHIDRWLGGAVCAVLLLTLCNASAPMGDVPSVQERFSQWAVIQNEKTVQQLPGATPEPDSALAAAASFNPDQEKQEVKQEARQETILAQEETRQEKAQTQTTADTSTGFKHYEPGQLHYESDGITVSIEQKTKDGMTYFVCDIQLERVEQFRTAFAGDDFKSGIYEAVSDIAGRYNPVLAINADFCRYHRDGVIIRNGEVLRRQNIKKHHLLVVDQNGDLSAQTDRSGKQGLVANKLEQAKTWQTFEFGPVLVEDGKAATLPSSFYVNCHDGYYEPRTAIGQLGPLHYIVIVVDEYGQTSGIVAMEDILEEIVGNIEDEHDQEEKMIEKLPDGSYLMDGMTSAEEALEILKIHIPEEDEFETLNGILISLLDRIPNDDEKFETDAFGYHFEVLQVENKMIKKVKITKLAEGVSTDKEENSCQKEETVLE